MIRHTVHFTGCVQGVGFRYTTRRIAARYPVAGYVQNLPDGSVRLVAEGESKDLRAFVSAVVDKMSSYVEQHTVDEQPATGEFGEPSRGALGIRM